MLDYYPAILAAILFSSDCSLAPINDDSSFIDNYPSPTRWGTGSTYVTAIEIAFNMARAKDSTINTLMKLPSQAKWDSMNNQQKALYILNKERYDRGIKPFEGYHGDVISVAQNYAQHLYDTNTFGHEEDGTPWERLNRIASIAANHDFFTYAENLSASAMYSSYKEEVVIKAIYDWIYYDASSAWGHRDFCLAKGLNDNSSLDGEEGLIGIGVVTGTQYNYSGWDGYYSTVIVMNAFDPSSSWDHSSTHTVSLCTTSNPASTRFIFDYDNSTITDTQTNLMWTMRALNHKVPDEAQSVCTTTSHAGFNDWQLPNKAQSGIFHYDLDIEKRTPPQLFEHCTAEVVSDGYVRTKRGADAYGGDPGSSIGFSGGANVRCFRNIE